MDLYTAISYKASKLITLGYSSSFGSSSYLFPRPLRRHIYAVYGLVRIADEIVDTYKGSDARQLLDQLEHEVYGALQRGYSTNPLVHAFAITAHTYHIGRVLIQPFFESMRLDLTSQSYDSKLYQEYIHGSAEVVGLMCLRVFCQGDEKLYAKLHTGAAALGSAYQKVNFLRDIAADYKELHRLYFPGLTFEAFDEKAKRAIIQDIRADFLQALPSLNLLPKSSRLATKTSHVYYHELLQRLENTPVAIIKTQRIRIPGWQKVLLFISVVVSEAFKR